MLYPIITSLMYFAAFPDRSSLSPFLSLIRGFLFLFGRPGVFFRIIFMDRTWIPHSLISRTRRFVSSVAQFPGSSDGLLSPRPLVFFCIVSYDTECRSPFSPAPVASFTIPWWRMWYSNISRAIEPVLNVRGTNLFAPNEQIHRLPLLCLVCIVEKRVFHYVSRVLVV